LNLEGFESEEENFMTSQEGSVKNSRKCNYGSWFTILGLLLTTGIAAIVGSGIGDIVSRPVLAAASGSEDMASGKVLPPRAKPHGYSLRDMAKLTAVFNSGSHSGAPPDSPIQILYTSSTNNNTFDVSAGTTFYVPVIFFDDSPPIAGDFPYAAFSDEASEDSGNRKALLDYIYGEDELGVDSMEIKVDGKVFSLGSDYMVGVTTDPLADGGGVHYIPIAGFLSPLAKGTHTVEIDGLSDGKALIPFFPPNGLWSFQIVYTVIVHGDR
jgi:hypothetical protein